MADYRNRPAPVFERPDPVDLIAATPIADRVTTVALWLAAPAVGLLLAVAGGVAW
jgi:hypothetical protein